jgi:hypothetical protein
VGVETSCGMMDKDTSIGVAWRSSSYISTGCYDEADEPVRWIVECG